MTVEEKVKEFLNTIFTSIGENTIINGGKRYGGYYINVEHISSPGIFIGRNGNVLRSIQYVLNVYAHKLDKNFPVVILDIDGYKAKQFEILKTIALNAALRAKRLKEPVELKPMSASARRIVHMTLKNYPNIWTHSIGREPRRRVVVDLKK
jgi:spoIIIJ-associated protein